MKDTAPEPLSDMAEVEGGAESSETRVNTGSTMGSETEPPTRIGGDLQQAALGLAVALGCTGRSLARYCDATRSAVCRWLGGDRRMPAPLLARVVALLPWLLVHLRFQMAVCRDPRFATLDALEADVDALVNRALADPRLSAGVEAEWSNIFGALDSEPGRAALAQITTRALLARPMGSA